MMMMLFLLLRASVLFARLTTWLTLIFVRRCHLSHDVYIIYDVIPHVRQQVLKSNLTIPGVNDLDLFVAHDDQEQVIVAEVYSCWLKFLLEYNQVAIVASLVKLKVVFDES